MNVFLSCHRVTIPQKILTYSTHLTATSDHFVPFNPSPTSSFHILTADKTIVMLSISRKVVTQKGLTNDIDIILYCFFLFFLKAVTAKRTLWVIHSVELLLLLVRLHFASVALRSLQLKDLIHGLLEAMHVVVDQSLLLERLGPE